MKQLHSFFAALLFGLSPFVGHAGVNDPSVETRQDDVASAIDGAGGYFTRDTSFSEIALNERCALYAEDEAEEIYFSALSADPRISWNLDAQISFGEDGVYSVDLPLSEGLMNVSIAQALRRARVPFERNLYGAVSSRLFPRRVSEGDSLELKFAPDEETGEPTLQALVFYLESQSSPIRMYRFSPFNSAEARYYDHQGYEYRLGLLNSPLEYTSISSFLGDGRRHQGLDLTAPVGTPIRMPYQAVVERTNWNMATQGYCVQVLYVDLGIRAKFFHLSRIYRHVKPGTELEAGEYFALSGNTGRSTGPHLHYQLEDAERFSVLNPIDVHGYGAPRLEGIDRSWFSDLVVALDIITTPARQAELSAQHLDLNFSDALQD